MDDTLMSTVQLTVGVVSRDNPWMYTVTLLSMDTLTRGSQAVWISTDDTLMSAVQLAVVVVCTDNPCMYEVTLSLTVTLTRGFQAV